MVPDSLCILPQLSLIPYPLKYAKPLNGNTQSMPEDPLFHPSIRLECPVICVDCCQQTPCFFLCIHACLISITSPPLSPQQNIAVALA